MEENKKLNKDNNQILNENKDVLLENSKKKTLSQRENYLNLDDKGYIKIAKAHSNANRPLNKINNFTEHVYFCPCCYLPSYTIGIFEPYSYCSSIENFSDYGVGIYLYFIYIKFAILILIIATFIAAIPMISINENYTKEINTICEKIKNKNCLNDTDWALRYRVDNIKNYRELFQDITSDDNDDEVNNIIVNYSIINFFCLITLFVVNIEYILFIKTKCKIIYILNTSPSDFTLFCTNLKNSLQDFKFFKKLKGNEKYNDPSKTENENFILFLKEQYLEHDKNYLTIENINLCYKLEELMEIETDIQNLNQKLFQIDINPKMILKNKDKKPK